MSREEKVIVLFDGVCNLCNGLVNFLIKIDSRDAIKFAPLQSEIARKYAPLERLENPDSFLVISNGTLYEESSAVFEVVRALPFIYKFANIFKVLPKSWRDKLYRFIARNRYKWFGFRDACMIPSEKVKKKFIS